MERATPDPPSMPAQATTTKQRAQKEVTFITPVLLGQNIPPGVGARTLNYNQGSLLETDQTVIPELIEWLPPGLIIEFPSEHIEEYARQFLRWLPLSSDQTLARSLMSVIDAAPRSSAQLGAGNRDLDLLSSQLFMGADIDT